MISSSFSAKPGPVTVRTANKGARSVSFTWSFPPNTGGGTLKKVEISYVHRDEEKKHSYFINITRATIEDLVPHTDYQFVVVVWNEFFRSDNETVEILTNEAGQYI